MLEDILSWLQLANPSALQSPVLAVSQSNFVFLIYLLTFKRSWRFAVAFLFCEVLTNSSFFGLIPSLGEMQYAVIYYVAICLTWSMLVVSQIKHTTNNELAFMCGIMILFLLFMAWDSWANADTATYAYKNYENIIVCIHACIILSLYKPRAYIDNMVHKLLSYGCRLLDAYIMRLVCYNFR